ncbi:MAG: Uncharacterised protein [Candidatus Poseidoniaceae archaeon]|nr:MAG: Uncharacterised protein [Candidatus Poseidoniaceae archaeon]
MVLFWYEEFLLLIERIFLNYQMEWFEVLLLMDKTIPEGPSAREKYWLAFSIPVGVGFGSSLVAFLMLSNLTIDENTSIVIILILTSVFHLGHIALWPLLAVGLFLREGASGNHASRKGALLALKCYAIWMVIVVAPAAWLATTMNGIV